MISGCCRCGPFNFIYILCLKSQQDILHSLVLRGDCLSDVGGSQMHDEYQGWL